MRTSSPAVRIAHEAAHSLAKDGYRAQLAAHADGRAGATALPAATDMTGSLPSERLAFEWLQQCLSRRRASAAGMASALRALRSGPEAGTDLTASLGPVSAEHSFPRQPVVRKAS